MDPVSDGFDLLLEAHPNPACIYDLQSLRLIKANAALEAFTGRPRDQLLKSTLVDLLSPGEADRIRRIISRARYEPPPWPLKEKLKFLGTDGRAAELAVASHTVDVDGHRCRVLVTAPAAAERETRERVRPDRRHDALTGLPERSLLIDRIRQRASGTPFAIFAIDIDRFRLLNRNFGLEAGDRILSAIAKRLESFIQPDEALVRTRADEFALLLEGIGTPEAARHMASEIQEALEAPLAVQDSDVRLTAGIGIAFGGGGEPPEDLLKDAETALHEAQASGLRGVRVFVPEMGVEATQAMRLERELGPGLERGDLQSFYQPLVSLRTGRLAGFESLARWKHPELGLILPGQFIPMAERTGRIADLGHRVMRDACRQVAEWQRRFPLDPPLFLTVNCSSVQFFDPKLAMQVKGALAESGLPPKSLKLELTESVLMEDDPRTMGPFERILDLGVQIIIDDFGTGFSSLSRLHRLPIEALKIDRSFVSGLTDRLDSLSVVRAIVQLARNFALKVTAEGVENLEQLRALRLLECDYGQGYYFAKPVDAFEVEKLLKADQRW